MPTVTAPPKKSHKGRGRGGKKGLPNLKNVVSSAVSAASDVYNAFTKPKKTGGGGSKTHMGRTPLSPAQKASKKQARKNKAAGVSPMNAGAPATSGAQYGYRPKKKTKKNWG